LIEHNGDQQQKQIQQDREKKCCPLDPIKLLFIVFALGGAAESDGRVVEIQVEEHRKQSKPGLKKGKGPILFQAQQEPDNQDLLKQPHSHFNNCDDVVVNDSVDDLTRLLHFER
jgi:hypothetical protein